MKRSMLLYTCLMLSVCALTVLPAGCQTAYYSTMEKFGFEKRDILVDRVEDARNAQQEAKDQFQSALDRFRTVLNFQGGDLEEKYEQLRGELEKSEAKAEAVREDIDAVEDVAEALLDEWESELSQYRDESLRRASKAKLDQTRGRYLQLIRRMKSAEKRIDPVLSALRDQVLFLKHNLNARAIASLQGKLDTMEADIASLIREMESSISEADAFIKAMSD